MPAHLDQDQVVKFYYGNAMKDLEAFLPTEDPNVVVDAQRFVTAQMAAEISAQPHPTAQLNTDGSFAPYTGKPVAMSAQESESIRALEETLGEIEHTMQSLKSSRKELSFLMSDITRLLGKK